MKLKFRADPKDVVIFIIFAIFLLYLVAIAVVNLHSFSTSTRFAGLNPLPAFAPNLLLPTIAFYFLALVGVSMGISSYFFEREKGFGYTSQKKKETGYTRWAKDKEIKEDENVEHVNLGEDNLPYGGTPLVLTKTEAWLDTDDTHSLIIGSTGSGKTQCFILPTLKILAKAGESIIVTDPKGEIYHKTAGMLKDKGYKIILLNFREPQRGNSWSPFSLPYRYFKSGDKDKATELIEDLANNTIKDVDSKADPFWQDAAADYFTALTLGLFEDAEEDQANFNSINLMETLGNERYQGGTYLQHYFKSKGELHPAYIAGSTTINAPQETRASIISSFRQKIKIFSSRDSLSEMLSESDFDYETIGKEKTAVFLIIHDEKKTYHPLATIFVKQAYEALVNVAHHSPKGKLPVRTNFLLDEFSNMPAITDVDAMVSAARSRSIRFNFIIQNYSQLSKTYGQDIAETIKGNCTNTYFLSTSELKALEEFSKLCGELKPKKNKDKPDDPIRPLVTVSDLQQLDKFQFVIKRLRCMPFKTKFAADFQIQKANGWGATYDEVDYPTRTPHEIKVFNIKDFVKKEAAENIENQLNTPDFMNQNSAFKTPNMGLSSGGGIPDMDEFIKSIDETIAKLEEEEKKEKERLEKEKKEKEKIENQPKEEKQDNAKVLPSDILEELTKANISNIEDKNKHEEKIVKQEVPKQEIKEEMPKQEEKKIPNVFATEPKTSEEETRDLFKEILSKDKKLEAEAPKVETKQPIETNVKENIISKENIFEPEKTNNISNSTPKEETLEEQISEKPKINVDVDSIIVDDNVTDDQFFDDFFGDDDDDF